MMALTFLSCAHKWPQVNLCTVNVISVSPWENVPVMHYLIINSHFGSKLLAARLPRMHERRTNKELAALLVLVRRHATLISNVSQ